METINICRDLKYNKLLELAINGKANYLITGDRDLLLNPFDKIEIITKFLTKFNYNTLGDRSTPP